VVASLQVAADADRMGGLAAHVARIARRRHPAAVLPEEVHGHFAQMGEVAVALASSAREVLIHRDPVQASRIRDDDAAMDELHRQLFTLVLGAEWSHGVAAAVDIVLLGRFYERFADHAAEIGRRVVFVTTGSIVG
jgi:phosphate transport system protein